MKRSSADFVHEFALRIAQLIEDRTLRERMGEVGRSAVEKGRFFIKVRKEQMKRVYEEALRK